MLKVYCATGFVTIDVINDLVKYLKLKSDLSDKIEFYVPKLLEEAKFHSYVYSDIKHLLESDVLLLHISKPTIGASAEFGMFLAKNPNKPIICYKCTNHSWLKQLSSYYVHSKEDVHQILSEIIDSKIIF